MRRTTLLALLFAALVAVLPISAQATGSPATARYIVVLKNAVDSQAVANLHAARYGANVDNVWSVALHGYSAVIPNDRVAALRADQNVSYVVPDGVATATAQVLPWGVDKIDADLSSTSSGASPAGRRQTATATEATSPERSARRTTPTAWSASRRAYGSTRSRF
jgi:subtilisin